MGVIIAVASARAPAESGGKSREAADWGILTVSDAGLARRDLVEERATHG